MRRPSLNFLSFLIGFLDFDAIIGGYNLYDDPDLVFITDLVMIPNACRLSASEREVVRSVVEDISAKQIIR